MSKKVDYREDLLKLKEVSLRRTAIARGDIVDSKEIIPENPLGEKLKRVLKASDFGCQKKAVFDLVSILSGIPHSYFDDVKEKDSDSSILSGIIVIPESNSNSHDYPLNAPAMSQKGKDSYILV